MRTRKVSITAVAVLLAGCTATPEPQPEPGPEPVVMMGDFETAESRIVEVEDGMFEVDAGCVVLRDPAGDLFPVLWEPETQLRDASIVMFPQLGVSVALNKEVPSVLGAFVEPSELVGTVENLDACVDDATKLVFVTARGVVSPFVSGQT